MTLLWPMEGTVRGPVLLVLVVVVAVGGVAVAVVRVVDVVAMGKGLVPAFWPVNMLVARVGQVGQRMLVVVAPVRGVGVAFVDIVGVPLALHAGVPAAGTVVVPVRGVNLMLSRCHDSSLLCWTASATMWATCWSARSITIASRAGAASTFRSSPAASNAFVCADTDMPSYKHM